MEVAHIEVIVTDSEGNLLANAQVLVEAEGFTKEGTTNTKGGIEFGDVPADMEYRISAKMNAYQEEAVDELVLPGSSSITLNLTLLP